MILFLRFSLVLVLIDKIQQTLNTVFADISKHLEVVRNTLLRVIFSTLFSKPE